MTALKKPDSREMCPPGYHVVRTHTRVCKSGSVTTVDAHTRKNRKSTASVLLKENIFFLYWNSNTPFKPLPIIPGFPRKDEYDGLIQFWLKYWQDQGLQFPPDLDALMIKALVSVESSFDPNAKTKDPRSTASGLMQITDQSLRILAGHPNKDAWVEVRNHQIFVEKNDRFDPVINVALGLRFLAHKFTQIPKRYPKNARSLLTGYHQWNKEGEAYADEILKRHRNAQKSKL
jgi:hypothetical protein